MSAPARTRILSWLAFGAALFGILVVTHLSLQIDKGFADGCAGLGASITAAGLDAAPEAACAAVATGEYADFLGFSNILWGLGFYVIIALLRLGYGVTGNDTLRKAAFGVVGIGALYTLRLVYLQAFVIGSFCVLCMMSALTVAVLLVLHILEHRKLASGDARTARAVAGSSALMPYGAIAGAFVLLLGADFALAGGEAAPAEPAPAALVNGQEPPVQDPVGLVPTAPGGCEFDPQFAPIGDLSAFLDNPSQGSGSVSVIEVFDPNCPHCRELNEAIKPVMAANLDNATFYSVAFPLRQPTVAQAAALIWARSTSEAKYFELKQTFFERQDATWGMTQDELRDAANSVGLDGPSLIATLNDQEKVASILESIQSDADAVQKSLTAPGGGLSTPKLIINGRVIAPTTEAYSERCLTQFIADASGAVGAPEAVVTEIE